MRFRCKIRGRFSKETHTNFIEKIFVLHKHISTKNGQLIFLD